MPHETVHDAFEYLEQDDVDFNLLRSLPSELGHLGTLELSSFIHHHSQPVHLN
jgi:hypothetical protein